MADLIDREKVERILHNIADHLKERNSLKDILIASAIEGIAIDTIHSQPAMDAVPVIRCKDCKYYRFGKYCALAGDPEEIWDSDDFCSQGERKMNSVQR